MQNQENNLISLKEAAKIYGYTQHHLGLLCRQGKLKAERIGKRWLTTKEWIDEYANELREQYKNGNNHYANGLEKVEVHKIELPEQKEEIDSFEQALFESAIEQRKESVGPDWHGFAHWNNFLLKASLSFCALLLFLSFVNIDWSVSKKTYSEIPKIFTSEINDSRFMASASDFFEDAFGQFLVLFDDIGGWFRDVGRSVKLAFLGGDDFKKEEVPTSQPLLIQEPTTRDGLVVFPDIEGLDQIKMIKDSFSDEVVVVPDEDGDAGIIQPIFKEGKGEEYIYVMVPVKEKKNLDKNEI